MKKEYILLESQYLSPYAVYSDKTLGRLTPIEECPIRTEFQRDRDRIIHSKAFRRLKHKTQVFLSPTGDHYRTRLTHTLEVTQIARTMARSLRLNEDLVEAIALGHDLGHTPFGHTGEKVLDRLSGHFEHNEQSLRVVDKFENNGKGLNLTIEVRDGILNHKANGTPATLEGKVVSFADRIAYLNHDIDDAERAGVLKEIDLPKNITNLLGHSKGVRINSLVADIIQNSYMQPFVMQSPEYSEAMTSLRKFMFDNLYVDSSAKSEEVKANRLIELLYNYFLDNPLQVPLIYREIETNPKIFVQDYIASMSDVYAEKVFKGIYLPNFWGA